VSRGLAEALGLEWRPEMDVVSSNDSKPTSQNHRKINGFQGKKHTPESLELIRKARAKQVITEETKLKWSMNRKGWVHGPKHQTKETRAKIGASNRGRPKPVVTCPNCDKSGGKSAMFRWHFNNCKSILCV
jgi:ribosomal protein L31E